jgi:hypothetical protein
MRCQSPRGWRYESPVVPRGDKRGVPVSTRKPQPRVKGPSRSRAGTAGKTIRRQVIFREVNERIERLDQRWGMFEGTVSVVCECGNIGCVERIEMTAADYEAVRLFPTRFLVKPGHVAREGERVIRQSAGCVVIEKFGRDAVDAIRLDPRRTFRPREDAAG